MFLTGYLGHGGSERQLILLLERLDPTLFEPHVLVFNPSPTPTYEARLQAAGVRLWQMPAARRGIPSRLSFLTGMLRTLRPAIVHSWTFYLNAYAAGAGRLAGVGAARQPARWGSLRNSLRAEGVGDLPAWQRWLCLYGVSRLVVNADSARQELLAAGYPAGRILQLPNCIEQPADLTNCPAGGKPSLALPDIRPDSRLIGLIGNFRPQKNPLLFVEAMARVLPRFDDVQALMAGQFLPQDPALADQVAAAIGRAGLDGRLVVAGFCQDVPALLHRLSVFCLTSDYEGMPNVVLEAMAAGCPVVATRVGDVPFLIEDGVNGRLVSPGDAAGLSQAVEQLLGDPDLARKLGANARQTMARFHGCPEVARQLAGYYRQTIEG